MPAAPEIPVSPNVRVKLKQARIARLATLDVNQGPHLVPICFAYDGAVFYSAIDRKPKRVSPTRLARLKNIEHAPLVALLIDEYDEDWSRLWYVLVRGEAQLVSVIEERRHAFEQLRAKYSQYRTDLLTDDAPIMRITPVRITAWGSALRMAQHSSRGELLSQAPS